MRSFTIGQRLACFCAPDPYRETRIAGVGVFEAKPGIGTSGGEDGNDFRTIGPDEALQADVFQTDFKQDNA